MPGKQIHLDVFTTNKALAIRCLSWVAVAVVACFLLVASFAGASLTGCQLLGTPVADPSPTPISTATTPAPTTDVSTLPSPSSTVSSVITLTLWTAPGYSPQAEGPAGEAMRQLLATFNETHSDIRLRYVLKKPQGTGGLLDFLLRASAVAPAVLPDLILLDPHDWREAAGAALMQPLDELLAPSLQKDLFPFALETGRVDGRLKGVQFETDVLHLLYNTNKLESPPLTWSDVLTRPEALYLFPAGGQDGLATDSFLIHYLSTGAPLFDEIGQLALDQEAMAAVLGYYSAGIQAGVVPTRVLQLESTLDAWPYYLEAEVAMTEIVASHYLANRQVLRTTSYASIPGQDGAAPTVSRGWMAAVVTEDPYRASAAASFLEWLLSPENNANWNLAAGKLPVHRVAYSRLSDQDPYFAFLSELLETARPYPLAPDYRKTAVAWQMAIEAVLGEGQTPEEAAAQVIETLGQ